ncbi:protein LTV1 homolog [Cylas formicarius]|uniref:protein LTV1 homolog n=1 Tax=Cylas formicarius TaxID=197179 RepID=UPI00295844F8|nr:protein LTV1 homolog [Cylas formicarius]
MIVLSTMPKQKTKGVTFQLVHRSQQDPLVSDETAPQRVLLPLIGNESKKDKEKRLEEQAKYGIYFDDDYNYLQHLKDSKDNRMEWPSHIGEELKQQKKEKVRLSLPSSVFASDIEEEIGMLNKAAPMSGLQLDLDPDIVAAMDDDFDYEDPYNELEDDFVELANDLASDQELEENNYDNFLDSNIYLDEISSLKGSKKSFEFDDSKSHFTNYSMTSSVIRRNDQLTRLDDRFEKIYAEYEDNEIGPLDLEEIEGHVSETSQIVLQYAEDFAKQQNKELLDSKKITYKIKEQLAKESDEEKEGLQYIEVKEKEKWDCESILSTYSNLYNHPKVIKEPLNEKITIDKLSGIPNHVLGQKKITMAALNRLNNENGSVENKTEKAIGAGSVVSQLSALSIRAKDESPEERRNRKKALKVYRKERRIEKKINSEAFKEESIKQAKIHINNKNNVQGNRIL